MRKKERWLESSEELEYVDRIPPTIGKWSKPRNRFNPFLGVVDPFSQHSSTLRHRQLPVTEMYNYSPLPKAYSAFRLLTVMPGRKTDDIICKLQVENLDSLPLYEALSYCWDKGNPDHLIICEGKILKVGANVWDALYRMRRRRHPRCMWVDAICINQEDLEERASQVKRMNIIYQSAKSVVVWLGNTNSHFAIPFVTVVVQSSWRAPGAKLLVDHGLHLFGDVPVQIPLQTHSGELRAFAWWTVQEFFKCPWFLRLWVVQEVVAAKKVEVVWGHASMSWAVVEHALHLMREYSQSMSSSIPMQGYDQTHAMVSLRQPYRGRSLMDLMEIGRIFQASDDRDRVFALLGMQAGGARTGAGPIDIQPDYRSTISEVYRTTAQEIIKRRNDLEILVTVQHGEKVDLETPSWIPQWHCQFTRTLSKNNSFGLRMTRSPPAWMPASADLGVDPDFILQQSILYAVGLRYDEIVETTSTMTAEFFDSTDEATVAGHWWNESDTLKRIVFGYDYHILFDLLLLSFTPGTIGGIAIFEEFWDDVVCSWYRPSRLPLRNFLKRVPKECINRRIIRTKNGDVGIGPAATEIGDVVCVLFGASMPLVLRPIESHYVLVGECFMLSLMYGDLTAAWKEGQVASYKFEIH
ncbi:hypothetical protein LTR84_010275 [Exophiala bonariae]|uniref:Heterokaryon incompatibility domain-containing protein n=1 Tax=Exophiala bonariae TaxID=1690606 RepID=A0AAV9MWC5_9EURO|nr:hypothetical protein LTR84_010275 [Exophiala bonariae]